MLGTVFIVLFSSAIAEGLRYDLYGDSVESLFSMRFGVRLLPLRLYLLWGVAIVGVSSLVILFSEAMDRADRPGRERRGVNAPGVSIVQLIGAIVGFIGSVLSIVQFYFP